MLRPTAGRSGEAGFPFAYDWCMIATITQSTTTSLTLAALDVGAWLASIPTPIWVVLGGVVGAFFTHVFARHRENRAWVKQRVFDSVAELNKCKTELISALGTIYTLQVDEPRTPREWQRSASMQNLDAPAPYSRAYRTGLLELQMLVPKGDSLWSQIQSLAKAQEDFVMTSLHPQSKLDANKAIRLNQLEVPIKKSKKEFLKSHTLLTSALARKYWSTSVEVDLDDENNPA